MTIEGKAVLVTGANRGLGQALVEEALRLGAARVYAGSRRGLVHEDPRVIPVVLDITDRAAIEAAVARVESLDILVNNAGVAAYDDLGDRAALDQHLAVNLYGTYDLTQAFLPKLTSSRGAIVNILSNAAVAPLPIVPAYSISKAAAFSLSQALRALLAARGVRVHAVLAGPIDTEMSRDFDVPKASPESVARAVFAGVERGEEEIFPDPLSETMAEGWRNGVAKAMERELASVVPATSATSFTTTFLVDQTPEAAYAAITDVRGWWSRNIDGDTDTVGGEFTYRRDDTHTSRIEVTELVPGRTVRWRVLENQFDFTVDQTEWVGTEMVFEISPRGDQTEIRFSHLGLVPDHECFDVCSNAWGFYIGGSLRQLIMTGEGKPNPREDVPAPT
jgi:NAD(P)-dependent dehydrogenase (short-subunit alcohol dehydrogenase family)